MKQASTVDGRRTPFTIVMALAVSVLYSGWLNLLPTIAGAYPATLLSDGITGLMSLALLAEVMRRRGAVQIPTWVVGVIALTACYIVLATLGSEPFGSEFAEVRTRCGYLVAAIYCYAFLRPPAVAQRVATGLIWLGLPAAALGIGQFIFRGSLPQWILVPAGEELFSYAGTDISRANGFLGNTIVFAAVMLLLFAVTLAKAVREQHARYWLAIALYVGAIFSSFSRMALVCAVGVVILLLAQGLTLREGRARRFGAIVVVAGVGGTVLLAAAAGGILQSTLAESFLVNGLFDASNASARGSTTSHLVQVDIAIKYFASNPFMGVGLATQRSDSQFSTSQPVITDGATWLILAEGGLLAAVPTIVFLLVSARALVAAIKVNSSGQWVAAGVLIFAVMQIGVASFLNSAILGKPVVVLLSILFGAALGLVGEREESSITHSLQARNVLGGR
jgi:hypothetical protein